MIFVVGPGMLSPSKNYAPFPVAHSLPGHGAPAILAALWIEGTLAKFFPQYSLDKTGLKNLIAGFSTPGGFPSHINAEVPGSIHEGGELGYALAVAFGAVMDKPELIVPVIIGDGEAETGPTAALVDFSCRESITSYNPAFTVPGMPQSTSTRRSREPFCRSFM